jgi:hypothetical protein
MFCFFFIGTWQSIFDLIIAAAVVTNGALIVFTMPVLNDFSDFTRFWIFVGFQWVVFVSQYVIRILIPDIPLEVELQEMRTKHINNALILRTPVEPEEEEEEEIRASEHHIVWNANEHIQAKYE